MSLDTQSRYPTRRAYVLKVRSDAKPDVLIGRIENLVTGQKRDFASGRELLDSLVSDLAADASEPPGGPSDDDQEGKTP